MDGVIYMKMRIVVWILTVALMASGLYAFEALLEQRSLAEKTVRLHVVANSDSDEDQALKLKVRDAVLSEVGTWTADCVNAAEARVVISGHLTQIAETAQQVLRDAGRNDDVTVSLGVEQFDTRYYDTFTLPAGQYPSLRVKLGAAKGHNWWCVVFPSLCTAATSNALEKSAEVGGFDAAETELITGGETEYTLRFKTLEWLQKVADWLLD